MTYLVEFQIKPNSKNQILDKFDLRGPNRVPGVKFQNAWIATKQDVIYVVGEAEDLPSLQTACDAWNEFGSYTITEVVDIERY